MPEESRTEFIQFCDKGSFVTPAAQYCWVKILDLRIFLPLSPFRGISYRIRLNFRSISYLVILISVGLPCGQLYGFSASINSRMSSSASLNERRLLPLTAALQDMDATFSVIRSGSWGQIRPQSCQLVQSEAVCSQSRSAVLPEVRSLYILFRQTPRFHSRVL